MQHSDVRCVLVPFYFCAEAITHKYPAAQKGQGRILARMGVEIFSNTYGYLNLMQAAALDIGRNDYQRWKANNFNSILAGWMAIGMAPLAVAVGVEAAPTVATVYLGNPDKWNTLAGELTLGAAGYADELPSAGAVSKGTTVLGHYPEYVNVAEQVGAKTFQVPTNIWNKMSAAEQWGANAKFLDRMILRGDNIRLATPLNQVKPGSFFKKS